MKNYPEIGVQIPDLYLPKPGVDLARWAVVACDQYTSQPEYWAEVEKLVGDAPSTLNLFLPEIYLGKPGEAQRIQRAQETMRRYLDSGLLEGFEGLLYVERTVDGKTRKGLMLCLDLERYDYQKGSKSLIRATEGTILERLPPRMKIREGAVLELPHILVLIDDPQNTVIEPVSKARGRLEKRYDFDLMMGSGHLAGYRVSDPGLENGVIQAMRKLADPKTFSKKYGVGLDEPVLLFAMGDGNHSLATAKAVWEKLKPQVGMDHPARYALVEIESVHDQGLAFEPIHRVLFDMKADLLAALRDYYGGKTLVSTCQNSHEMIESVEHPHVGKQLVGFVQGSQYSLVNFEAPTSNLAVGTLQPFLDSFLKEGKAGQIDYLHGSEVLVKLASQPGNAGFYLPAMDKSDLFKTVILDGALPRKTFSMGEAHEKRFYMESRKFA